MEMTLTLPVAFSVRDYHEFQSHRDALQRMNPIFCVDEVATGRHMDGGPTVYWGVIYVKGDAPDEEAIRVALTVAGFNFSQNGKFHRPDGC